MSSNLDDVTSSPMMPNATGTIHQGHGLVMLSAQNLSRSGLLVRAEPFVRLSDDATDEELGAAIRIVLEGAQVGVPDPPPGAVDERAFAQAMGLSSRVLGREIRSVAFQSVGERIYALVSRTNARGEDLFTGEKVWSDGLEDAAMARAVRTALDRSS